MKPRFKLSVGALIVASTFALSACKSTETTNKALSEADAVAFLDKASEQLVDLNFRSSRSAWIYANFITHDTASLAADVNEEYTAALVELANQAAQFDGLALSEDTRRKLDKLKLNLTLPAPKDADKTAELAKLTAELDGMYGKGKYCKDDGTCLSLGDMTAKMANSRDYEELLDIWQGWREVSKPMRPLYEKQVVLTNEGANELGYADTGAMWRSKYDMPADDFAKELDRTWNQVKPLYDSLHCHVRAKLGEKYGEDKVPQDQPIPAHLLGNMWAQSWGNIYDLVAPENADPGYDVTALLAKHNYDEIKMVKGAEKFFTSMGFAPLPETFYERSLFIKPQDRDVQCHASAWNLDAKDDLRIKMCIQRTGEEFSVIHHELGHNFYQRAYNQQPVYYQESANDGFHEAIGDTIALSVTPGYLKQIGLLDNVPDESKDIGLLMKMALDKVAFIPFGLLVDQWRWKVFSGEISPAEYNQAWWELREKYQGVKAPISRTENDFDPGAKYHVPGNVPYTRYFLAHILQFQFHKSLCEIAGSKEAIHRCSVYNSKAAGERLNAMLEMGSSKPWQQALKTLTGKDEMDATAVLDYFAPLQKYLDEQNKGRNCGW
ncbi:MULTISPECIES: M2 family metallopeptidase [Pseudoalteromonas]|uniref:M2 family metallopeptidase n=1 Tax=Pseudoalteromonas maricaloris TaxID=184924 RepID=A0A8I2GZ98_9GAMM|nr:MULTISPECIES: M2 family metallopeptidase [Pseudoalteromonas]KID33294.1 peptidyl-dipeptidase [Pseudoalteromonas flavipulchra NCIMB 2033 = ATCC BAA-314]MBD0781826.1 M2 family metallopeptidase [Pseudoalteromonas flavipulchra]MBE0373143.1 peptidyl-dipeptidase A [Pseudoalteromonas flavipulchra NCIMB 2033 = ATCC BAA-314]MCG7539513.1 M2 family metallopeptidase [Pseudoalteromonas sp. OF7H-1]NLR20306.1 M2 family metallopeptidase [Pseudoalteromonas maricaloris]